MKEDSGIAKKIILIAIALIVLAGLIWGAITFFKSLAGQTAPPKQKIQTFKLVAPPPPPPPPPPPEVEEPPEPEDEPEPEPEPEPESEPEPDEGPDETEGGDDLTMDGPLGEGDAFGIGGGKPKCTINCGRGTFTKFAGSLKQQITRLLTDSDEVRKATYNVILKIWITKEGRIERTELLGTSGNANTDDALLLALASGKRIGLIPPKNMPQPVKMRIISRI